MMIRKRSLYRDLKPRAPQHVEERRRIPNRAKRPYTHRRRKSLPTILQRRHTQHPHLRLEDWLAARQSRNFFPSSIYTLHVVASRNHNAIGPAHSLNRLTQSSVRQKPSTTPRIRRVDRYNIQIARESQMLKAIIENKTIRTEVFNRFPPCRNSIGATNNCREPRQLCRQQIRLVTRFARRRKDAIAIRNNHLEMRIFAAVTARQDANLFTVRCDCSRDVFDEWCLAGAASGDVSDADHRTIEFGCLKSPTTIERESRPRDRAIKKTQWWQDD